MSFENPLLLVLIAPALALISLSVLSSRSFSRRSLLLSAIRAIVLGLLIVAVAGPRSSQELPEEEVTALVDISSSMSASQGERLLRRATVLSRELQVPLRLLPFGATSEAVSSVDASYQALRNSWQKLDAGSTNIEAALRKASALSASSVLLLTDGYETAGNALHFTSTNPSHLRIFALTENGDAEKTDIFISQLYAPLTVKAQSSADVKVTLSNASDTDQRGRLIVSHGDKQIFSEDVSLQAHTDSLISAQSDPAVEGISPITATFSWTDKQGAHQEVTRSTWLAGETRDKVLILSGTQDDSRILSEILRNQSYQLTSLVQPFSSEQLGPVTSYRSVILNNVPFAAIPPDFAAAIPDFLRNAGGGLIMVGGNKSFGLGGYIGTVLETILPVRLVPPYKEKKRLNVAIQLVIDKSRSMAADERLEFAKAAASEVLRSLHDDDYIGVIGFDQVPFIALPLSPVGQVRTTAAERISRLYPTNKTNLYPALDEARRALQRVNAGRKHAIILTDGKIPDASSEYISLIRQMRVLGITASTVLIGADVDDGFLAQLAESGGGSFYRTSDPQNLPRIFLSDVKVASGEQTLRETPDLPVQSGPSGIVSTTISSFPTLRGFVETLQRDTAHTELVISEAEKAYPLLASMKIGKGRSIAFTSDANGRWSSYWLRWPALQTFWSDLLESLHPKTATQSDATTSFDVRSWVEGGELIVDLTIFGAGASGRVSGEVLTPRNQKQSLDLKTIAPGHYQARLAQPMAGKYEASFAVADTSLPTVAWSIAGDSFGEHPHEKPNLSLLERLASQSSGLVNPTASDLRGRITTATEFVSHSPLLLLLALLFFFAEILLREYLTEYGRRRNPL